jgi:hypothetical protein
MSKEIKIDENSYLMLLNKVLKNKEEERDLALDRYRKADESIQTNDHFMLLGKNAATFLGIAAQTTNDLANLAKEIKSLVYKESDNGASATASMNDAQMRAIIDAVKNEETGDSAEDTSVDPEDTTN